MPSTSVAVSDAGKAIEVHQAAKLQAPQQDVELASASVPVEQKPDPAAQNDVADLRKVLPGADRATHDRNGTDGTAPEAFRGNPDEGDWDHPVKQWNGDWVRYDDDYRPVICNPYHEYVKIVYVYEYQPRIVLIPPLASVVIDALDYGAYSFTALAVDAVGAALDVAVGSFFGGGYYPGPDLAPPPPPPPPLAYDNVPVFVRYTNADYQPFVVRRIVDVGDDPYYGEHKVLLDGVTPAWGAWTQTPDGQRQFEVHKTQQFPGLEDPNQGPLPGDYQLRLANDSSSGFTARDLYVVAAGAVVATLGLCATVALAVWRRRTRALH